MTRALAVLCVRNEGAFLLDWLAHHRAVGFTDFLVFSNDCDDGTDLMLDRLQAMGTLTHIRNQDHGTKGPQWSALRLADRHPAVAAAEWVMVLDIDEYVNIHVGAHRLSDLWAAVPQATAIPLTWRMFGNAGVITDRNRPVTEVFTRAAPSVLYWPWRAQLFKTLHRNDGSYRRLGVHRPRDPDPGRRASHRWFDGSGRELPEVFHRERVFSPLGQHSHRIAQLNHYALGSMEGYLLKSDRGRANREGADFDMGYWVDRNFCDVEDRTVLALDAMSERAALTADPVLSSLHRAAVVWRQQRVRTLMQDEAWRAFFGRLMMTPPTRVLSEVEARRIWQPQDDLAGANRPG
ncbi:MAG: glycosyltransferase family 2 protein [Pseudomonadota bacterium]